jgi:competence protein ComEC
MGVFHYLNVKDGDCSIIQHLSGRVTVVDVSNASKPEENEALKMLKNVIKDEMAKSLSVPGNFNQKLYPVNPIEYLSQFNIDSVFRFILTHPDMDHMDGIEDFFNIFKPANFWDSNNNCNKDDFKDGKYKESDWLFYKALRDGKSKVQTNRLTLHSNAVGKSYNRNNDSSKGGDGLYILSPTKELVDEANESEDYNDASYVLLYRSNGGKILLAGDSNDKTWEYLLKEHKEDIKDVDVLLAPHHGRKSDRSFEFLDIVNPTITFFGNANSTDLAYDAWNNRKLDFITNNQANCMIVDTNSNPMRLYVTNKTFAEKFHTIPEYSYEFKAYYLIDIVRK